MDEDELFTDPERIDLDYHWWQGPCRCDICGYECQSVVPILREHSNPIVPLECDGCGGMTLNPVEFVEE